MQQCPLVNQEEAQAKERYAQQDRNDERQPPDATRATERISRLVVGCRRRRCPGIARLNPIPRESRVISGRSPATGSSAARSARLRQSWESSIDWHEVEPSPMVCRRTCLNRSEAGSTASRSPRTGEPLTMDFCCLQCWSILLSRSTFCARFDRPNPNAPVPILTIPIRTEYGRTGCTLCVLPDADWIARSAAATQAGWIAKRRLLL